MASRINPNTIDANYPVAGVNQSSAGFRKNFQAIQDMFQITTNELNDLMNKSLVSAPLDDGPQTTYNDGGGRTTANLSLSDFGVATCFNSIPSTTMVADFTKGMVQHYTLNGTPVSLNVVNFPNLGYSELYLDLTVSSTTTIQMGNLVPNGTTYTTGSMPVSGYNSQQDSLVVHPSSGNTIVKLSSSDGYNWRLDVPACPSIPQYEPTTSIGTVGDTAGIVSYGNGYLYVCTGNYDGATKIWNRVALETF